MNVAYFAATTTGDPTSTGSMVAVSVVGGSATNTQNAFSALTTQTNNIQNYYLGNPLGNTTAKSVASAGTGTNSYFQLMDAAAANFNTYNVVGSFTQWLTTYNGEVTANASTPQDSNLFQWVGSSISQNIGSSRLPNYIYGLNVSQAGALVANLETEVTGNGLVTQFTSDDAGSPTPVPRACSFWHPACSA